MVTRPVVAERLVAQGLSGTPGHEPVSVVERLLAVQAQDLRGARLAIRARSRGVSSADVDRALSDDRSIVVTWLNRGTLHLVRADDLGWLHAITTPRLRTGVARRLAQEGVTSDAAERGVGVVERALADEGPLTRARLRERLDAAGVRTQGQALVHVLALACLRGIAVRGPIVGRDQAFVLTRDWLGPQPPVDRDGALAELARRYLVGHGPAGDRDLAKWAGIALGEARAGLRAIAGELDERGDGSVALARRPEVAPPMPPPRLLGPFDPLLLGWASRDAIVGRHGSLITVNGLFRPFALVGGRAVATWRIRGGDVAIEPLEPLSRRVERALEDDADDVRRFLGPGS